MHFEAVYIYIYIYFFFCKSKDKEEFKNYRPVSLLPCISKILEKIIHKRLYNFLLLQIFFMKANMDLGKIIARLMRSLN